jgi:hypothetical protein
LKTKRLFLAALAVYLFLCSTSLFAQMGLEPSYHILVSSIEADSALQDEASQLYESMFSELSWQGQLHSLYALIRTSGPSGAMSLQDLALSPPYIINSSLQMEGADKVFTMTISELSNNMVIGQQELAYRQVDEALGYMAFFCWSLSSTFPGADRDTSMDPIYIQVPGEPPDERIWKDKWLYIGPQGAFAARLYQGEAANNQFLTEAPLSVTGTFEAGVRAEVQFLAFPTQGVFFSFSLETGADFTMDLVSYKDYTWAGDIVNPFEGVDQEARDWSFTFPALLKFNIKPRNVATSFYGGGYFILPMKETLKYENPWGVMGGFSLGINAGPGLVFLDFHYAHDLGFRTFHTPTQGIDVQYTRDAFAFSVGYRFGLIDRNDKSAADQPIPEAGSPAEG